MNQTGAVAVVGKRLVAEAGNHRDGRRRTTTGKRSIGSTQQQAQMKRIGEMRLAHRMPWGGPLHGRLGKLGKKLPNEPKQHRQKLRKRLGGIINRQELMHARRASQSGIWRRKKLKQQPVVRAMVWLLQPPEPDRQRLRDQPQSCCSHLRFGEMPWRIYNGLPAGSKVPARPCRDHKGIFVPRNLLGLQVTSGTTLSGWKQDEKKEELRSHHGYLRQIGMPKAP
jgi:hypothetical protein